MRTGRFLRMQRHVDMPSTVFDDGMQAERTALSWERTSVSLMVIGVLMVRQAAVSDFFLFTFAGIGGVVVGSGVLVWAGLHYDELHTPLQGGHSPVHPRAVRILGLATIVGTGLATSMVIAIYLGA